MSSMEVRHLLDGKCSFADFMLELGRIASISHTHDPDKSYSSFLENSALKADTSRPILERLEEEHAAISAWNRATANRHAEAAFQAKRDKYVKDLAAHKQLLARHAAAVKQASRWQPPTAEHEIVKERALSALKEEADSHRLQSPWKPTYIKGSVLKRQRLESLSWAIERLRKDGGTVPERTERHAAWMKALCASLGLPDQA
jgi:hypothetical protein